MIEETLKDCSRTILGMLEQQEVLRNMANLLRTSLEKGGTIWVCGNGGSAAEAQHMSSELLSGCLSQVGPRRSIALTTDTSVLTAVSNDHAFDEVFARQIRGLGRLGDVVVGISTSGNSANVLQALKVAAEMDLHRVALTGSDGGRLLGLAEHILRVPSENTQRIQEAHHTAVHILCQLVG